MESEGWEGEVSEVCLERERLREWLRKSLTLLSVCLSVSCDCSDSCDMVTVAVFVGVVAGS